MLLRGKGDVPLWQLPVRVVLAPAGSDVESGLHFIEGQTFTLGLPELSYAPIGKLPARSLLAGWDYAEIQQISITTGSFTFSRRLNELPQAYACEGDQKDRIRTFLEP